MDSDKNEINEEFKDENIEITGSAKVNVDDEDADVDVKTDVDGTSLLAGDIQNDDELDSDKMDYEAEEKNYL